MYLKHLRPILVLLPLCALVTACNRTMAESQIRDFLDVGPARNENPLGRHGLADIFNDFDPAKPVNQQWPHVAITVIKTPPFHALNATDPRRTKPGGVPAHSGCWSLKATVWHTAQRSEIKNFDWCFPRHATLNIPGAAGNSGFIRLVNPGETSGLRFTEGPMPPESIVPLDAAHRRFFQQNGGVAIKAGDVIWFSVTMNGLMLENIGNQMGFGFDQRDPRLWIAGFSEATEKP